MAVHVNTSALRTRLNAMAPRLKKAVEEIGMEIDRRIGEEAVGTMLAGDVKQRNGSKGLRANAVSRKGVIAQGKAGKVSESLGANLSPFLRIISGKAARSLKIGGEDHIHQLQWIAPFGLHLVVGSSVKSAKGFPYLLAWEMGIRGRKRSHLVAAWQRVTKNSGQYADKLAAKVTQIFNES